MNMNDKLDGIKRMVTFKVTNASGVVVNNVSRVLDYSALTLADVLELAEAAVVIKVQRTLRAKSESEIEAGNGSIIPVQDAGKTPETPETLIAKLKGMGLTAEQIAAALG